MPKLKVLLGSILAAAVTVLGLADAPDQYQKLKGYAGGLSTALGIDWAAFWSGNGGRYSLILLGIAIGLWAWEAPQRLWRSHRSRNDPSLVEQGRRRFVISEIKAHLEKLYYDTASNAFGDAQKQLSHASSLLRAEPTDAIKGLTAMLLSEVLIDANRTIQPVLDAKDFQTESGLQECLAAWADLFNSYQQVVLWTFESYRALGIDPWSQPGYAKWRDRDLKFITAMKHIEHMEGCESMAGRRRAGNWGEQERPPRQAPSAPASSTA